MARVLSTTSSVTSSVWHLFADSISRAMTNLSDNIRELQDYKFEE